MKTILLEIHDMNPQQEAMAKKWAFLRYAERTRLLHKQLLSPRRTPSYRLPVKKDV